MIQVESIALRVLEKAWACVQLLSLLLAVVIPVALGVLQLGEWFGWWSKSDTKALWKKCRTLLGRWWAVVTGKMPPRLMFALGVMMVALIAIHNMWIGTLSIRETFRILPERYSPTSPSQEEQAGLYSQSTNSYRPSQPQPAFADQPLWSTALGESAPVHQPKPVIPKPTANPESPQFDIGWKQLEEVLPMPLSQIGIGRIDSRVYLVGGRLDNGNPSAQVFSFDPETRKIAYDGDLNAGRSSPQVVAGNRTLYALGGSDGNPVASVERYDASSHKWKFLANPMPTPRSACSCAYWQGTIFSFAGEYPVLESLETRTEKWKRWTDLNFSLPSSSAVVWNDLIYLFGGAGGPYEVFDPRGRSFRESTVGLQEMRSEVAFALREDGTLFAVGGTRNGIGERETVEVCHRPGEKWWPLSPLPARRADCAAVAIGMKIFVFGGRYARTVDTIFEGTIVPR